MYASADCRRWRPVRSFPSPSRSTRRRSEEELADSAESRVRSRTSSAIARVASRRTTRCQRRRNDDRSPQAEPPSTRCRHRPPSGQRRTPSPVSGMGLRDDRHLDHLLDGYAGGRAGSRSACEMRSSASATKIGPPPGGRFLWRRNRSALSGRHLCPNLSRWPVRHGPRGSSGNERKTGRGLDPARRRRSTSAAAPAHRQRPPVSGARPGHGR